jgi:hypothetical protein
MFSETSVLIKATRYKVPEDICYCYRRENFQEDSVFRSYVAPPYGEATQEWFHGNTTVESYHPEEPWNRNMFSETSILTRESVFSLWDCFEREQLVARPLSTQDSTTAGLS